MLFHQTFDWNDLAVVGLLVLLEGVLSIDNALVLGLLARRLPKNLQPRALTYGLVGAFVFRLIAIVTAAYLLRWRIVKLLGGGYLVYVAVRHLFFEEQQDGHQGVTIGHDGVPALPAGPENGTSAGSVSRYKFWSTVAAIEVTDIAFAVDSILAAIALVGSAPAGQTHPKLWVVITGGMLGVILMRFAAVVFIRLLERFPRFETAAYLLVLVIGAKLLVDWGFNSTEHPHRVDFHDYHALAFWVFWLLMVACFLVGFLPQRRKQTRE